MHGNAWANLLRHIPPTMHDQLMLVTVGGTEIAVSTILRVDHEFLAFKGRLAATQDQGRLFFIPFQNIDYVGTSREVKDEEYHAVFGSLVVPPPQAAPVMAVSEAVSSPPPSPAPALETPAAELPSEPEPQTETAPIASSASNGSRTPSPIKSAVLERFRLRSGPPPAKTNGEG
jgi:hypothetical protein